jgi:magnesium chelatase family protein
VAARVAAARQVARRRLAGTPWTTNAEVPGPWLRAHTTTARDPHLEAALDSGVLSLRGVDRVLRVAWTLADLAGRGEPGPTEIGQALLLRTRGRVGR